MTTTWTTPEAQRTQPQHMTSSGDAFQRMVWTLEVTPLDSPLTRDDLVLIAKSQEHDANTDYLARLAAM